VPGSLSMHDCRQAASPGVQVHCQQKRMSWQPKSLRHSLKSFMQVGRSCAQVWQVSQSVLSHELEAPELVVPEVLDELDELDEPKPEEVLDEVLELVPPELLPLEVLDEVLELVPVSRAPDPSPPPPVPTTTPPPRPTALEPWAHAIGSAAVRPMAHVVTKARGKRRGMDPPGIGEAA
jgi:hypothetical protein